MSNFRVASNKYTISQIPGEFEKRVFVGGNYDNIAVLREIAKMVENLGYQPILALDFDAPEDKIREYDLILLHNCKYAIFEITFGNGHLIEIERAQDYKLLSIIIVYQVRDKEPPPGASQMVLTTALPKIGYRTFDELREHLLTLLPPLTTTVSRTLEIAYKKPSP